MLSDDSSSDSETGRFKGRTKHQDDKTKSSSKREDNFRSAGRSRPSDNDRFRRDFVRKRDEGDRHDIRSRERHRFSRHSPIRRRHSRERSAGRRSRDRDRHRQAGESGRSKPRDHRSPSRERHRHSRSMSRKSPEQKQEVRKEIKQPLKDEVKHVKDVPIKEKRIEKFDRPRDKSSSPDFKGKRSVIQKPETVEPIKPKVNSPKAVVVEELVNSDVSDEVQPGSYYSMIPAVVKEKSESSEIDSSDDERLRAKLLNLERELHKTRKKKHKKKHKRKSSKSSKDRDRDSTTVEVTSTTDVDKVEDISKIQADAVEVTSTQKSAQKESSEEGEITSDTDLETFEIDATDLRHKLKGRPDTSKNRDKGKTDICGPALPPHLQKKSRQDDSKNIEGPALPPHLKKHTRNIGPSIPEDMRKVLAETDQAEVIIHDSSDEDTGIGPVPVDAKEKWTDAHQRLEERALDMKIRKLDGRSMQDMDAKSREQWMLELPEGKAKYLGLEARSFRAKAGPDMSDRSSWTDTPEEKARKAAGIAKEEDADEALRRDARSRHIASRDEEQEKAVKKHKKKHKREESLLDMHQKKLKKKKKKEDKDEDKKERRPFSRDVDLQVNRFDEAQKKSIIKKAQGLNTRFSGGEAKFL